jgi:hypothetical protein
VLGSNQRRLSRRFYSTLLLPESLPLTSAYALRGGNSGCHRPLCVRERRISGPCGLRTEAEKATDGAGRSGHADRLALSGVDNGWHYPMGLATPAATVAMPARRYMHCYGAVSADFGLVSVADRRHAASWTSVARSVSFIGSAP